MLDMRTNAWQYLSFTFAFSLLFWSFSMAVGGVGSTGGMLLHYAGGAGPVVAALVFVLIFESVSARRDFWVRLVDPRRMGWLWFVLALLLHPMIMLGAVQVQSIFFSAVTLNPSAPGTLTGIIVLVLFVFVFGPLPEEMGWRGVALDRLHAHMSPVLAAAVLGLLWAAWHVPLFFIEGTFQHGLGAFSPRFWIFMADLFPLTVIIHWIYNRSDRSTLSAVLVHFSGNVCGAFIAKSDQLALIELVGLVLVAALILWREGSNLGRCESNAV